MFLRLYLFTIHTFNFIYIFIFICIYIHVGASIIKGIQDVTGDGGVPTRAAACMKHFIAYSDPVNGHDRSPVLLPDRILQQIYRPSFQAAIDAGVMTAMESYQEVRQKSTYVN